MQIANSTNLSPASEIISALQIVLRSQAMIPDIETPYSRTTLPNPNHCAIELKAQSINEVITDRQQQLDATLHDISSLETVIEKIFNLRRQLTEQKEKLISSITLHKRLVSPLWRLPTEVLSIIFVHCLPEDKYLKPTLKLAPVLLTRVCRRWREVAVGMPSLWCRLKVPFDFRIQKTVPFCLDVWLKRSQGHPLSLALTCVLSNSTRLRSLLQPYISQISSFHIRCLLDYEKPEPLLQDLPALQELVIDKLIDRQCFSRLPPTLRNLKLIGLSLDSGLLLSCKSVWANLTDVEISRIHPTLVIPLLQLCPNLCSFAICLPSQGISISEPLFHVNITSLRIIIGDYAPSFFGIDYIIPTTLPSLFNAFTFPNLRTLEVHGAPWSHEEFKAFVTRSNCPLETVIVGAGVRMELKQRAEVMALIPSLEIVVSQPQEFRSKSFT